MPFDNTKPKAKNLARGVIKLPPAGIAYLNAQVEGFGDALSQALGHLNNRADVQAGHGGSVAIAKQTAQDPTGRAVDALKLHGDTIGGVDWANRNDQVVPLEQMRAFFTCDHFGGHPSGFPGWFEDCVGQTEQRAVEAPPPPPTPGIVHSFWGYSFHIPNSTDTISADAGFNESDHGAYYQMIIPVACTIDRLSFWRDPGSGTPGFLSFGLYDMNRSRTSFPVVAKTAPFHLSTVENGLNVVPLDARVDIAPGVYAYAYTGPCFHSLISIRNNVIPWIMVNALYNATWNGFNFNTPPPGNGLPPFGSVITPFTTGALPDVLDSSTVDLTGAWDASSFSAIPLVYFDDSQEFG